MYMTSFFNSITCGVILILVVVLIALHFLFVFSGENGKSSLAPRSVLWGKIEGEVAIILGDLPTYRQQNF